MAWLLAPLEATVTTGVDESNGDTIRSGELPAVPAPDRLGVESHPVRVTSYEYMDSVSSTASVEPLLLVRRRPRDFG